MKNVLCAVLLCASAAHAADSISFKPHYGNGYPEGVAWHAGKNAFIVSSLRGGTLGMVSLDGQYRVFSADKRLLSSTGIVVDSTRGRVLVTNSDVGVAPAGNEKSRQRTAQVFEFDADSGALRHIYDFSALAQGATFANDLTIDAQGNIYVTDSFQPQIYQARYADKTVSVFVRDSRLHPEDQGKKQGQPNLNGIVHHPDGYLLAGDYAHGKLWRIPLNNPKNLSEVRLPKRLKGPDGLVLKSADTLVAIQTSADASGKMHSEVTFIRSNDGWQTARVQSSSALPGIEGATTATIRNNELWTVNSRYPTLFAAPEKADMVTQNFKLIRVFP